MRIDYRKKEVKTKRDQLKSFCNIPYDLTYVWNQNKKINKHSKPQNAKLMGTENSLVLTRVSVAEVGVG